MSLLALFVGIFLIYNFSMFSVLSRREDMSLLLTMGSDRRGIVAAFLLESWCSAQREAYWESCSDTWWRGGALTGSRPRLPISIFMCTWGMCG